MADQTIPDEQKISYEPCLTCGCTKPKVFVHGHYQCEDCKCVGDGDCCQGSSHG
jgi:hypothetical protein